MPNLYFCWNICIPSFHLFKCTFDLKSMSIYSRYMFIQWHHINHQKCWFDRHSSLQMRCFAKWIKKFDFKKVFFSAQGGNLRPSVQLPFCVCYQVCTAHLVQKYCFQGKFVYKVCLFIFIFWKKYCCYYPHWWRDSVSPGCRIFDHIFA